MAKLIFFTAFAACLALTSTITTTTLITVVQSTPLEYNPRAVVRDVIALTHSHPAFGSELASDENTIYEDRTYIDNSDAENRDLDSSADVYVLIGPNGPIGTTTSASPPVASNDNNTITFANERISGDANASNATGTVSAASMRRRRRLEASSTDIQRLESFFQTSMERNVKKLATRGSVPTMPWPSSYWPVYQDGINYQWNPNQPSPAAKYAAAFGLNVQAFTTAVSQTTGVLSQASRARCSSNFQCSFLGDGSSCAKRAGDSQGYCIPTWFGICHAWAPAAILESEPRCAVTKNGVTFQPLDIKALVTQVYDGAALATVFTGVRFNGPDKSARKDQYGRYVDSSRRDLGPGYLHIALGNLLGRFKKSFILDVTGGAQVWNQPVYSYQVLQQMEMTAQQGAQRYFGTFKYPFNSRALTLMYVQTKVTWMIETLENGALVRTGRATAHTSSGTYSYVLELDANKNILGGEWVGSSRDNHPDFLWFATGKPADSTVTSAGISYRNVKELLAASLQC